MKWSTFTIYETPNIPELNRMNWPKQWKVAALKWLLLFLTFERRKSHKRAVIFYVQCSFTRQKSMKLRSMNLLNALLTGSNVWRLTINWTMHHWMVTIRASSASRRIYHPIWWYISWAKFHHKNHHYDRYIANEMEKMFE